MLDVKFIRENADRVKKTLTDKNSEGTVDIDILLKTDAEIQGLTSQLELVRRERNELDKKIKTEKDQNIRSSLISQNTELKRKLKGLEDKMTPLKTQFDELMLLVPNVTFPKMPVGKGESENVVLKTWGEPKRFDFTPRDHVELGEALDLIEIKKAGDVSGSRFYYLKNEAVLMQFGLIQLVMETLTSEEKLRPIADKIGVSAKTFTPVIPPVLMKPEIMKRMDRLDPIDDRYQTTEDGLMLIGSAEHTLGPLHMDEVLLEDNLPLRYIGCSTAFRRESGTYGKDTKGIFRVHQFDKLEMESFTTPDTGEKEQEFLVAIQESLVQQLGIPYQLIQICTGDTGKPDYNQYDINCWLPAQGKYRETHTSDYMTDFQSRRLNIRYKAKGGDKKFVYMNDATAFAVSRTLIAILENYQQKDGSVLVPEVLQRYVGKDIIKP